MEVSHSKRVTKEKIHMFLEHTHLLSSTQGALDFYKRFSWKQRFENVHIGERQRSGY